MALFDFIQKKQSLLSSGVLQGSTDYHSHILFGVDDGVATIEEALDVLSFMESAGITELWCTPHIMEDVPNTTEGLKQRFAELQQAYKGNIRLHLAAEYMLDTLFEERFSKGDLLTMEDETILVETSTWNPPPSLYDTFRNLLKAGYRPLFAHPERYRYMNEASYENLNRMGVHMQLNLASLTGFYGETAKNRAKYILENGWYNAIGSDCHRIRSLKEQFNKGVLTKDIVSLLKF